MQPVGGAMRETLIIAGVFAIMAAIVGGGVVFPQFQFPPLKSLFRQLLLGLFGAGLIWGGLAWDGGLNLTGSGASAQPDAMVDAVDANPAAESPKPDFQAVEKSTVH